MPKRNKTMVPIPAEIMPRGREAIASEYKAMIAKIVEEKVLEALTHPTDSDFQPFFQPRHIANEIKRRQTVQEQHKFSYAYNDWGCLVCGTKDRPYQSLWMCKGCYSVAHHRLLASIRKHSPGQDEPRPTFVDTVKLARAALAPSIETLAKGSAEKMSLEKPIPAGRLVRARVACNILGLSYDTLRFWLRKGWFEPPSGNTLAGHVLWSAEDIERLRLFAELRRELRRHGAGPPRIVRDPARIVALRRQGLTWEQVALEMGISVSTAVRIKRREVG